MLARAVVATRFVPVHATRSFLCDTIGFPLCDIGAARLGALDDSNDFGARPAGKRSNFYGPGDSPICDPTPECRNADLQSCGALAHCEEGVCELHLLHLGFD